MNKEINHRICELYNYNVGIALNILFDCINTENNLSRLEAAKKLIAREIELERFEYWIEPTDYNLPRYFDSIEPEFEPYFEVLSNNVYSAIHYLYGGYNEIRLMKCLDCIEKEIKLL
jgi:hypothetical protein